jgi:hypothetical protein
MKVWISLVFSSLLLWGVSFQGTGIGVTEKEAKKSALSDLSNNISVTVKSKTKALTQVVDGAYQKQSQKLVELSTTLPIKSAYFTKNLGATTVKVTASLDSNRSLETYLIELKRLKKEIDTAYALTKEGSESVQYDLYQQLLADIETFNQHKIVASLLGAENLPHIDVLQSTIKSKLINLQERATTLKGIARILSTPFKTYKGIYIASIKPEGSLMPTQFSRHLKNNLEQDLQTISLPDNALYIVRGFYEVVGDTMYIALKLIDGYNRVVETSYGVLDQQGFENLAYKVKVKNFDHAMATQMVLSGDLRVQIGFKGYLREHGIDLRAGQSIDIVAKTNQSVCYFLQGYTLEAAKPYTYLLPISDGKNPYIGFITGQEVNQMVTIASGVEIAPPFGSESLQIFAQTLENGQCTIKTPYCKEDTHTGLCLLQEAPEVAVSKTRALFTKKQVKNTQKQAIETAENIISFSTSK